MVLGRDLSGVFPRPTLKFDSSELLDFLSAQRCQWTRINQSLVSQFLYSSADRLRGFHIRALQFEYTASLFRIAD